MISQELFNRVLNRLKFKFPYLYEEYIDKLIYEVYHKHTMYSSTIVPDSGEYLENYAKKTKEYGGKCLFSGEHGFQGNQYHTYKICEKENLKFRYSVEAYWVKNRLDKDRTNCHMIIIAKSDKGRRAINLALSIANEDGYYVVPRLDLELIKGLPVGEVMITTACVAGWKYEDCEEIFLELYKQFGNDFFIEMQYHNTDKQKQLNLRALKFARKNGISIIYGSDSHYVDSKGEEKRNCILEYKNTVYGDEEGWYLDMVDGNTSYQRFKEQGILSDEDILECIMNTNYVLTFEDIVFSKKFKIPTMYPSLTYEERCREYMKILNKEYKKDKIKSPEKIKGIQFEARQVMESGTVDYFLTNYHIMKNKDKFGGILTTTSRGSSASFVTNKLLGFTTVDRYNSEIKMYPERFLTKDRVLSGSMPD